MAQGDLIKVNDKLLIVETKEEDFEAQDTGAYYVDTTTIPIVVDIPPTVTPGTVFVVDDYLGNAFTNNITIQGNGGADFLLHGSLSTYTIDSSYERVTLTYVDGIYGWRATVVELPVPSSTFSVIKAADFTAGDGGTYYVDCSGGAILVDLPLTPVLGTTFVIDDYTGNSLTNNITVQANGGGNFTLEGVSDVLVIDANNAVVTLTYVDATFGWRYNVT